MTKKEAKQFITLTNKLQKAVFENKIKKGFNIRDIPLEFCFTSGELAEAFEAWRKKQDNLGEELADVAIYLFGLSTILKTDLGKEIMNKIAKNKKRQYCKVKGVLLKQ